MYRKVPPRDPSLVYDSGLCPVKWWEIRRGFLFLLGRLGLKLRWNLLL
jgi:hypothetical protein